MSIQDLNTEGIVEDPVQYQIYSNLRTALQGSLLDKNTRKFVQNDGMKRYRISTHPDFITYNKEKLLLHELAKIQRLVVQLP